MHYSDVILNTMASQITSVPIVCSTVCWEAQIKEDIGALRHWPLRGESIWWTLDSPYKGLVTQKKKQYFSVRAYDLNTVNHL